MNKTVAIANRAFATVSLNMTGALLSSSTRTDARGELPD
jgi:hypothetical protein